MQVLEQNVEASFSPLLRRYTLEDFQKLPEVRYARTRGNQSFWEIHRYGGGESAASEVLKGWQVSVDSLFEGLV